MTNSNPTPNWRNKLTGQNQFKYLPVGFIAIHFTISVIIWSPYNFIGLINPFVGELFEAYHGALNITRFGWQWAGLQDMATNPDPAAHPFMYMHHVNFGLYFSYFLSLIGIKSIELQNFYSIFGALIGLYFGHRCFQKITGAYLAGIFYLIFSCVDFFSAINWSFNIHRAFTNFAVFGVLLSYLYCVEQNFRSRGGVILMFLSTIVLIGTDYMFYFSVLIMLAGYPLIFWDKFNSSNSRFMAIGIPIALFGAAFAIRQVQVMIGVGLKIWAADFLYQVLNRLHLEHLYPNDWSKATTAFYEGNNLLNPGFAPLATWPERVDSFLTNVTIFAGNYLGIATPNDLMRARIAIMFFLAFAAITIMRRRAHLNPFGKSQQQLLYSVRLIESILISAIVIGLFVNIGINASIYLNWASYLILISLSIAIVFTLISGIVKTNGNPINGEGLGVVDAAYRVAWLLFFVCAAMYGIFPRYFMQWFPSFGFIGICIFAWTIPIFLGFSQAGAANGAAKNRIEIKIASGIFALKIIVVALSLITMPDGDSEYSDTLNAYRGESIISNWTSASVSSFTDAFSAWVKPEAMRRIIEQGEARVDDYYLILEKDKEKNELYLRPDYFLVVWGGRSIADQLIAEGAPVVKNSKSFVLFDLKKVREIRRLANIELLTNRAPNAKTHRLRNFP